MKLLRGGFLSLLVTTGFSLMNLAILHETTLAQVTTADLEGKITDVEGQPIASANVIVKNQETGIERGAASAPNGRFRISGLTPGIYEVTARHVGFTVETRTDLGLSVGQVANLEFKLSPGVLGVADAVVVVAKTPLVETTESDRGIVVEEAEIRNLPLNSRNVVELALLSPGVTEFRSTSPPFSPLNFGALNNRATRVFVDGIDFGGDQLGGISLPGPGLSQNAVHQFEVITNRFKAEYGNAAGGIINLISKSGTNQFQGSVFGFFRDEGLNAPNHFDTVEPSFERQQFGLTLGGPLVKDRTHFFLAFERNQEDAFAIVNTNNAFPELEGSFLTPNRESNLSLRFDHQLSTNHWLTAKYALEKLDSDEFGIGGIVSRSQGTNLSIKLDHLLLRYNMVPSSRILADFGFGFVKSDFNLDPFDLGPSLAFPSVQTGGILLGRQRLDEERLQFRSDISYHVPDSWGEHNWKFGFDVNRVKIGGSADILGNGLFIFPSDTSSLPFLGVIAVGDPNPGTYVNHKLAFYLQDDWSPLENLTFNLGLRYEIETNATNQNYVSSKTDPDLPFIVMADRPVDKNNLAPRIGFAWDPWRDGKTAIRGGYGIFYGRIPGDVGSNYEKRSDRRKIYTILNPGTTNKSEINFEALPYRVDGLLPPKVPIPYTKQFSAGLSRQLTEDFALDIDYIGARGFNEIFPRQDVNPLDPTTFTRPLPQYQEVFVARTDGKSFYNALQLVVRKRFSHKYQFRASYTLSEAENDSDDPFFVAPGSFKRGPARWDERHRFVFDGLVLLPFDFQVSWIVSLASARPYSIFTGNDDNLNGNLTDDQPPGVSRNSERADGFSNVDLRLSRLFKLGSYNLELIAEVFNLFNTTNFNASSYVGNQQSPNFGRPTIALTPRQVQLGFRMSF